MISNNATTAMFSLLMMCISTSSAFALEERIYNEELITPIPLTTTLDLEKLALGEKLFNDVRLSKNNSISCASCHQLKNGGDDNKTFSLTTSGGQHIINTPTVFNARYNFRQNWDGAAANFSEQIAKIIPNHLEANTNWETLLNKIKADSKLKKMFLAIYSDGITRENYIDSLSEFEMSLVTPNARFDQYLRGNLQAINNEELEGYLLFKEYGCISCHQGINIGGNIYQKLGIFYDYFSKRGNITTADYGRQNITNRNRDKHVFKVPTLRNIEVTSPYFHDGKIQDLQDAILIMGKTQLGITIKSKDILKIEKFLKTLTGEYKGVLLNIGESI